MKNKFTKIKQNESGEVMLEASIILVSVLLLLMALLSISFWFYEQAMLNCVATEIAYDVAKNYKYTDMEIGENTYSVDAVESTKLFGMTFGRGGLEKEHEKRAEEYLEWRIPLATLGFKSGITDVDCEFEGSGIGRVYVKVTVENETNFFLSNILEYLGITNETEQFRATAYAECVDLVEYTSLVNFTEYTADLFSIFNPAADLYENVKELVQRLID